MNRSEPVWYKRMPLEHVYACKARHVVPNNIQVDLHVIVFCIVILKKQQLLFV